MADALKTPAKIRGLNEVGRYAIGVQWSDGHDSIYPLENLRRGCPCNACGGNLEAELAESDLRLAQFSRLGEAAILAEWSNGHETLYTIPQLRGLCRCAMCIGEPERPLTGR